MNTMKYIENHEDKVWFLFECKTRQNKYQLGKNIHENDIFKLRLKALIPRSVNLSVCLSVGGSVCPP